MKRLIPFFLIVLVLAGCNSSPQNQTVTPTTQSGSLGAVYAQANSVEPATNGAVSAYTLTGQIHNIEVISSGLVLDSSQGKLGILTENNSVITSDELEGFTLIGVHSDNLVLFNVLDRTVLVVDDKLHIDSRFSIEEGISDLPVYGSGTNELYYCVDDYIRALDLETGLTRHIVQHTEEGAFQITSHFNGLVIGRTNEHKTTYFSSVDGQNVFVESSLRDFSTGETSYYGIYRDGYVDQYIWGQVEGTPSQLLLEDDLFVYPQMLAGCIITVKNSGNDVIFDRYDMDSGLRVGSVQFKPVGTVIDVSSTATHTWILTDKMLYRWDWAKSPTSDDRDYMIPLIDGQNPDVAGIDLCKSRAKSISEQYGIDVLVWDDALLNDDTYEIAGEYQVLVIEQMLDKLEVQLPLLPEQILDPTKDYCGIKICLVRSIDDLDFVQFWNEDGLCILITPTADVKEALFTGLGWAIDSRVIGNSRDFDYWNDLNPTGFTYDYSYFVNSQREDLQYLDGETRAFVDQRAMSFPSEDRARIFYYSLLENNGQMFSSDTMQEKLKVFCEGVREAYGWQKDARDFPWEQYLNDSLAYEK